jgi:circadian clock protein KaiB
LIVPDRRELTLEQFRDAVTARGTEQYELTLFVSGASESSARAITNIREICDAHLGGRHQLDIVDLNQEPGLAGTHHVLATPTLIKDRPLPLRMLVGDMSDHVKVLLALDIQDNTELGSAPLTSLIPNL